MNPQLDQTDKEILRLLSEDKTKKEIAAIMFLSYSTVKKRLEKLKLKAQVSSNGALLVFYIEQIKEMKKAS